MFSIILDFLKSIKNDIQNDINRKISNIKKEGLLKVLTVKKAIYISISGISFILGNFTSAITLIFYNISPFTIYFMLPSAILLYLISILFLYQFIKSTKDKDFLDKQFKFEEKLNIKNTKKD